MVVGPFWTSTGVKFWDFGLNFSCVPRGAQEGQNDKYLISTRDEHGLMICKAPHNAYSGSLQAHTKFQEPTRPSWRADVSFSPFWPPSHRTGHTRGQNFQNRENCTTTRHDGRIDIWNFVWACKLPPQALCNTLQIINPCSSRIDIKFVSFWPSWAPWGTHEELSQKSQNFDPCACSKWINDHPEPHKIILEDQLRVFDHF